MEAARKKGGGAEASPAPAWSGWGFQRLDVLWLAPVLIFAALVFWGSLDNGFVHDDWASVARNSNLRDLGNVWRFFVDPRMFAESAPGTQTRPVLLVTYALNYLVGDAARGFRLVNLLIHLLNVVLVYRILLWILSTRTDERTSRLTAILSAALFSVHPLNAQAVIYVSSRSVLLATLFYLLAVLLFLRWRASSGGGGDSWGLFAGVCAVALLSMLSKENAVSFAGAVIVLEVCLFQSRGKDPKRLGLSALAGLLPAAIFMAYRSAVVDYSAPAGAISHSTAVQGPYIWQLATQVKALLTYARLYLWPDGLALQHSVRHVSSFGDPLFLGGLAIALPVLIWSLSAVWRGSLPAAAVLWFFIGMAPESLLRLNMTVNEHRFYLPGIGWFAMTVALLNLGIARARASALPAAAVLVVLLCLGLGYRTYLYTQIWADECTLWDYTAKVNPDDSWSFNNLGNCRLLENDLTGAEQAYMKALGLDPTNSMAAYNLAGVLERQGRLYPAIAMYRKFDELTGGKRSEEVRERIRSIQQRMAAAP